VSAVAAARAPFVEVPTAAFALARAAARQAGLDAASLEAVRAAARRDIEEASRDLAHAIERRPGSPPLGGRARRRQRRRLRRAGADRGDE
jgi:hypothetical protein